MKVSYPSVKQAISPERKGAEPNKNVVVFTTHKAGSMLLFQLLLDICKKNNIAFYSPNESGDKEIPLERMLTGDDFLADRQGCFGPLRFFLPSAILKDAGIIVHLRDPRDVLTSMFFSYCYMHPGEIKGNTGYRKEVADAGIDKFVLDMSGNNSTSYQGEYGTGSRFNKYVGNIRDRYVKYLAELVGKPNVTLLSYEEMVLDFGSWLRKFLSVFELSDPESTYDFMIRRRAEEVKPGAEDVWSHKRKVTPGDFKEKLRPETIVELNERFREVLDALGYSDEQYEKSQVPIPRKIGC